MFNSHLKRRHFKWS